MLRDNVSKLFMHSLLKKSDGDQKSQSFDNFFSIFFSLHAKTTVTVLRLCSIKKTKLGSFLCLSVHNLLSAEKNCEFLLVL